jgi:hypothetical protein
MDTTETYTEMCRKAFLNEQPDGALFVVGDNIAIDESGHWWKMKPKFIPLKSQDQLQKMVEDKLNYSTLAKACSRLGAFQDTIPACKSWEQLWLAFVMKEKYNKVWDGTEWVNEV